MFWVGKVMVIEKENQREKRGMEERKKERKEKRQNGRKNERKEGREKERKKERKKAVRTIFKNHSMTQKELPCRPSLPNLKS